MSSNHEFDGLTLPALFSGFGCLYDSDVCDYLRVLK